MMGELLNPKEAATMLRCSIHTIRSWVYQRRLPVVRLGRKILFRKEDLETFVEKNVVKARKDSD